MRYFQNPTLPRAEKNDEISHSSKTAIISTAKKILQRNFSSDLLYHFFFSHYENKKNDNAKLRQYKVKTLFKIVTDVP
jgi:hypothetical protein